MKIAIVYDSVSGNTFRVAQALSEHFSGHEVSLMNCTKADLDHADVIFAGSWTDKGDCSAAMAKFLESLTGQAVFLFGTCGYGESQEYFDTIARRFAAHVDRSNTVLGQFVCQGKMPPAVLERYESMRQANPDHDRWDKCIANYYAALSHPNQDDFSACCIAADTALEAMLVNQQ